MRSEIPFRREEGRSGEIHGNANLAVRGRQARGAGEQGRLPENRGGA